MKHVRTSAGLIAAALLAAGHAAAAPKPHRDVAVMMLALPGRGAVLSAPGETVTIVIENARGQVCKIMQVRSGADGLVQVPVAQTRRCPAARIVVQR